MMNWVIIFLLPFIFVLLLPAFKLFLCSYVTAAITNNDVVNYNIMLPVILYLLLLMDQVLLLCPIMSFHDTVIAICGIFVAAAAAAPTAAAAAAAAAAVDDNDDDYASEYDFAPAVSSFVAFQED